MHINVRRRLARDPWFWAGTVLLILFSVLILAAPWLAEHDPRDMSFQSFSSPSAQHWLGVNDAGMDLFAELVQGIKNTAAFGLLSGLVCLALGVVIGLVSAWFRGVLDLVLMRLSEVLMAVPAIMILILLAAFLRPEPWLLALVLAGLSWPSIAKVIRAQALSLKSGLHIQAARQMGASGLYIIRRHLLPELYPLYLIGFASKARMAIFMEATLGFLGLFDPSRKSLGMMINQGLKYYYMDIWLNWLIPPILSLSLLIMGVTFLAISLEKIFDPRLREAV
ncbi:MAG: ABC transporter permease [Desulfovermiculus sp.]|nr:ABC transporter permease [Desulfovermiculus sp.]